MVFGSTNVGMGNAPYRKKEEVEGETKASEILSYGKGPLREIPDETEIIDRTPATFVKNTGTEGKVSYDAGGKIRVSGAGADTAANMHMNNREVNRGEEGYRTREFNYNVYDDPMFQQYLKSAKINGQNAMTDTIAKSAAMTGGIASSYAAAAGAGAYNDYMQGVNDVIPELEQLAYQKYQDELARDRNIYEMDEAKRWENAERATIAQKVQNGEELTDEEKIYWNAGKGNYIKGDVLVGANGEEYHMPDNLSTANKSSLNMWQEGYDFTEAERQALINAGYTFKGDTVTGPDGNTYVKGANYSGEKLERILGNYMAGNTPSVDDIIYLLSLDAGYGYENGVLTLDGEPIKRSWTVNQTEIPDDFFGNPGVTTQPSTKSYSGDDANDKPADKPVSKTENDVDEGTINAYKTAFMMSNLPGHTNRFGYQGYEYNPYLSKEENAYAFVSTLDENEDVKKAVYEELTKE